MRHDILISNLYEKRFKSILNITTLPTLISVLPFWHPFRGPIPVEVIAHVQHLIDIENDPEILIGMNNNLLDYLGNYFDKTKFEYNNGTKKRIKSAIVITKLQT